MRVVLIFVAVVVVIAGCTSAPQPPSTLSLRGHEGAPVRLMVQEVAYGMQEKALQERDSKTLSWIWSAYEWLDVPTGTRVKIVQDDPPTRIQVEIADGPHLGRRGWLAPNYLAP